MQEVGDCFTFLAARAHNWVCFRTYFSANGHLKASDIVKSSFGCDFPSGSKLTTVIGVGDSLNVFCHHSHTQKALPCVKTRRWSHNHQDWFRRSTCGRAQEKKGMVKMMR